MKATNSKSSIFENHSVRILIAVAAVLVIPLIWMQFSDDVEWTLTDFIFAGALLLVAGFFYDRVLLRITDRRKRLFGMALLALAFMYLWAELAVGIFTNLGS